MTIEIVHFSADGDFIVGLCLFIMLMLGFIVGMKLLILITPKNML
jgi:hypothetical protein